MKKTGAALLTVLVAMMIMSIMLFEFQYASMVERKLAYNDLNQLQAYYLAKSGVRIGLLRVVLYGKATKSPELTKSLGSMVKPYLEKIWNLPLPAFPPEGGALGKMLKTDRDAAEKTLKETKVAEGQVTHVITNESSKINLNFLEVPASKRNERLSFTGKPQGAYHFTGLLLINLMERFIRESDDAFEEFGNLKPEEVVFDIMDWINPGSNRFMGGNKDAFYEQQKPPYKAKRGHFYSVEELRLVRGIDDKLYNKLKPHITVYSDDGRININNMTNQMLRAVYPDFTDDDVKRLNEEKTKIGGTWPDVNTFVKYITETLGRSNFKKNLDQFEDYPPLMTESRSFLIESSGVLKKGQTDITKIIRVGVSLTGPKAGQVDLTKNQQTCNKTHPYFWDTRLNLTRCTVKPRTDNECINIFAGTPVPPTDPKNKSCCTMQNNPVCWSEDDAKAIGVPSSVKILHWSEA